MKTTRLKYFPAFATALTAGLLTACVSTPKETGFFSLFDGKSLNGWRLLGKKGDGYGVKDGVIYCARGGGGNLFTEKEYADFILFFFQAEDGIRDYKVTGVQTCALPI